MRVSGLELGGLVGSLIAGRLSDWLINRAEGRGGNVGKRVQVTQCTGPERGGGGVWECCVAGGGSTCLGRWQVRVSVMDMFSVIGMPSRSSF
jgi:hypothetical protein